MGESLPKPMDRMQRLKQEMPAARMAKALLPEEESRERFGKVLRRVAELAGLDRRQMADALDVDESQLGRWWAGKENPQVYRYHAHPVFSVLLMKAQAEVQPKARMRTVIEIFEE